MTIRAMVLDIGGVLEVGVAAARGRHAVLHVETPTATARTEQVGREQA